MHDAAESCGGKAFARCKPGGIGRQVCVALPEQKAEIFFVFVGYGAALNLCA